MKKIGYEVIRLVNKGLTYRQIAKEVGLEKTQLTQ